MTVRSSKFKSLFSSKKQDWRTPKALYRQLDAEFNFDFDPCPVNPSFNGLVVAWKDRNFVNPPYNEVEKWIQKGFFEFKKGKLVVFLVAARTDTKWFHRYVLPHAKEIRFLKGRLKFSGCKDSAPFPSMVIVFGERKEPFANRKTLSFSLYPSTTTTTTQQQHTYNNS